MTNLAFRIAITFSTELNDLQIAARESGSWLTKLTTHLRSFWNVLDVVLDITLTVAVILRLQDYVTNDRAVKVRKRKTSVMPHFPV